MGGHHVLSPDIFAYIWGVKCRLEVLESGLGLKSGLKFVLGSLKISRRNPCSPFLMSVIA